MAPPPLIEAGVGRWEVGTRSASRTLSHRDLNAEADIGKRLQTGCTLLKTPSKKSTSAAWSTLTCCRFPLPRRFVFGCMILRYTARCWGSKSSRGRRRSLLLAFSTSPIRVMPSKPNTNVAHQRCQPQSQLTATIALKRTSGRGNLCCVGCSDSQRVRSCQAGPLIGLMSGILCCERTTRCLNSYIGDPFSKSRKP